MVWLFWVVRNVLYGLDVLTLEVLPCARQQLVEHVEGPLVFGLADGSGLLQEV